MKYYILQCKIHSNELDRKSWIRTRAYSKFFFRKREFINCIT